MPYKVPNKYAASLYADRTAARIARLEARVVELETALKELRIRYHAAGRRPEECHAMSIIDAALAEEA